MDEKKNFADKSAMEEKDVPMRVHCVRMPVLLGGICGGIEGEG